MERQRKAQTMRERESLVEIQRGRETERWLGEVGKVRVYKTERQRVTKRQIG
jgi:hypothetical protein